MGRRRAPLITVPSDDFVIREGDEEYHPHEGEVVTFKRKISSRDLLTVAKASELSDEDSGATEMARFFYEEACPVLARAIFSWTWTDMYDDSDEPGVMGTPLGKKGKECRVDVETLRDLDATTEIQYLLDKWLDVTSENVSTEANPPKPSS